VRDVALHAGDVPADLRHRVIEFRLAAAGDEDVGALGDEPPGGGQADAAVALVMTATLPSSFSGRDRCSSSLVARRTGIVLAPGQTAVPWVVRLPQSR
jgi:hypothetical protein